MLSHKFTIVYAKRNRSFHVQIGWLSQKYLHGYVIEIIIYIKERKGLLMFYKMTLFDVVNIA